MTVCKIGCALNCAVIHECTFSKDNKHLLQVMGYLIVDDMLDIRNVKPSSSNIRREEDTAILKYKEL